MLIVDRIIEAKWTSRPCNAPVGGRRGHANPSLTTQTVRILADPKRSFILPPLWNGVVRDPFVGSFGQRRAGVLVSSAKTRGASPTRSAASVRPFAALRLVVVPLFVDCGDDSLPVGPSLYCGIFTQRRQSHTNPYLSPAMVLNVVNIMACLWVSSAPAIAANERRHASSDAMSARASLRRDRMLMRTIPCSCGRHTTWRRHCGELT